MARIVVVYGSHRENRQGIKAARFVSKQLEGRGHEVDFIDTKEVGLPILEKMHKSYEQAPKKLEDIHVRLDSAEAFVFIVGEYNHSVQPGLKNFIDHFQREYFFKPAGIVSYSAGGFAGMRAAVHFRAILGELGMVSVPTLFGVSAVQSSFDDEGNTLDDAYPRRIKQFLDELEWYVQALNEQRAKGLPY